MFPRRWQFWAALMLGSSVMTITAIAATTWQGVAIGIVLSAGIILGGWWRWVKLPVDA